MTDDFLLSLAEVESIKPELLFAAAQQPQADRFAVHSRNRRNTYIDVLIARLQIHAPVLRQPPLRNVHVRHYLQARNDGRLQNAQLRRHGDLVQNSVNSVPNSQIIFEWLNMDVSRAFHDRFADDLVYELHNGGFRIVGIEFDGGLGVLQCLERTVRLKDLVESLRTDSIERFHCPQKLRTRHQHPFHRLFQQLRCELAADRIEKVVRRQHDRSAGGGFLHFDRQNVMLKHKTARQNRQRRAIDLLRVHRDNGHPEKVADCAEETLL